MENNYVASYVLGNDSAVGIIECENDFVVWDLISGENVIDSGTSEIEYVEPEDEVIEVGLERADLEPIFRVGEIEISLNECMRI